MPSRQSSARPSPTPAGSPVPGAELSRHVRCEDGSPGEFLRRLWRDLYGDEPPAAPDGLLAPDPQFRELDTSELLDLVPSARVPVLRRGRALLELGRRASDDTALLPDVAAMIRDPGNRRLITVGAVSVSQLGTAGLLAGGGEPVMVLAGSWPRSGRLASGPTSSG